MAWRRCRKFKEMAEQVYVEADKVKESNRVVVRRSPRHTLEWASLRDAKAQALRDAASNLRRLANELAILIEERTPIRECEIEVSNAQNSLTSDLNQFFRNAELYRDGVSSGSQKPSLKFDGNAHKRIVRELL
jgi:hypothetical protein